MLVAPDLLVSFALTLLARKEFMSSPISRDMSNNNAAEAESETIAAQEEEEFGLVDEDDDTDDSDRTLFEFVSITSAKL